MTNIIIWYLIGLVLAYVLLAWANDIGEEGDEADIILDIA